MQVVVAMAMAMAVTCTTARTVVSSIGILMMKHDLKETLYQMRVDKVYVCCDLIFKPLYLRSFSSFAVSDAGTSDTQTKV